MKLNKKLIAILAGLQLAVPALAQDNPAPNSTAAQIEALQKEVQLLERKVDALEQRLADQAPAAQESAQAQEPKQKASTPEPSPAPAKAELAATNSPQVSLGSGGLKVASATANFAMNIRGYVQLDSRTFFSDTTPGADGFLLRRVHPIISGTVWHDFDYQFMAEFGGAAPSIFDAYVNYHPWQELQLEVGRFKMPVGLEWLQSAQNISFNERSLVSDLVPHRDLGVELHGDWFGGQANYAAGIFNSDVDGADTGNSGFDNRMEFAGRIFFQPWKNSEITPLKGLGFGVGGSSESETTTGALTGGYKTDGQQKFFAYNSGVVGDGAHWRVSPQAYYYWGPFDLLGEYVISDQKVRLASAAADLQNTSGEISAGWMLTGEKATYGALTPQHPFSLKSGGWGAWQIVARYEGLAVDKAAFPIFANPKTSASAAQGWAIGLNWWLNRNVRIMTSLSRTTFTGGDDGAVTGQPEDVLFTRMQLGF